MTKKKCDKHAACSSGPGLIPVLVIGALIGYLLTDDLFLDNLASIITAFCWGVVISFLFLQCVYLVGQTVALLRDPLPADTDLANRPQLQSLVETLCGSPLRTRLRHLLETWMQGWDSRSVIALATFQSGRIRSSIGPEIVFVFIFLLVASYTGGSDALTVGSILGLGLILAARHALNGQTDAYIERRLLTRLPAHLPHTAMTASELAGELGARIEEAFELHVPQPQQMAEALRAGIEGAGQNFAKQIQALQDALMQNQTTIVQTWSSAAKTTTSELRDVEKALATVVSDLTGGLSKNAERLHQVLAQHTQELQKLFAEAGTILKHSNVEGAGQFQAALKSHMDLMSQNSGTWNKQLQDVLGGHITTLNAATKNLAGQMEKIVSVSGRVEEVLHVNAALDSTLKGVASTEEFRQTMSALRTHIEASDDLLRELSKPRIIRLVETEEGISEADGPS